MTKHYEILPTGFIMNEQKQGLSAKALIKKEFPETKWVVDDLLPEGLTILTGAPKIGKSFFCLNLALAVSQAGVFLSEYKVSKPKNVLYFALDNAPQRQIQSRLKMIQPDVPLPDNVQLCSHFPTLMSDEGLQTWEETIKAYRAELVIVDTMHPVLPQINTGTAHPQDYSILLPIQEMVHRLGISMILVTYALKMTDIENLFNITQGNVGAQAACDTMMILTTDKGNKVLHVNGREILPQEIPVDISNGVFVETSKDNRE